MKNIIRRTYLFLGLLTIISCNHGPKPIDYGNDGCQYCKMTIVDKIHGAELITDKGKVFKFDATECMLNYIAEDKDNNGASYWTNHYDQPTALIAATEATYLISEKLPSPMGAYLTAFENAEQAEKVKAELGGKLYTWEALKKHLQK